MCIYVYTYICHLQVAKLAGLISEAMILCGEKVLESTLSEQSSSSGVSKTVHLLSPPTGSVPGTRVFVKGFPETARAVPPKTVSGKIWDKVKPLLRVMEGCAKYDGNELITALGTVLVPGCADDASIL